MISREEANKELKSSCGRVRPLQLQILGKAQFIFYEPKIPDYIPPGEYEIKAFQIREKEDPLPVYQNRIMIEEPEPEEPDSTGEAVGLFREIYALREQIANEKASAKDEFYKSMLAMQQENYKLLNTERKQMRDEFLSEREKFLDTLKDKLLKQMVSQASPAVVDEEKETAMDRIIEQLIPTLQPVIAAFIAKAMTPNAEKVVEGAGNE